MPCPSALLGTQQRESSWAQPGGENHPGRHRPCAMRLIAGTRIPVKPFRKANPTAERPLSVRRRNGPGSALGSALPSDSARPSPESQHQPRQDAQVMSTLFQPGLAVVPTDSPCPAACLWGFRWHPGDGKQQDYREERVQGGARNYIGLLRLLSRKFKALLLVPFKPSGRRGHGHSHVEADLSWCWRSAHGHPGGGAASPSCRQPFAWLSGRAQREKERERNHRWEPVRAATFSKAIAAPQRGGGKRPAPSLATTARVTPAAKAVPPWRGRGGKLLTSRATLRAPLRTPRCRLVHGRCISAKCKWLGTFRVVRKETR